MSLFEQSEIFRVQRDGVALAVRRCGLGPPLLLLHGHPQSHAMWHRVAPSLASRFSLVMMDLRGYGDSDRPPSDPGHLGYAKREMALDAMAVMRHFGFERFQVLAHDRGARVAHRLALDHPKAVQRMMLLDIAPTLAMYEHAGDSFARAYWHWFFLIQPPPLPEALIESDPVRYLRSVMGRRHGGLAVFDPEALSEYERCILLPGSARGICEDYRAAATIDLVHDRADREAGMLVQPELRVLWGQHGAVGQNFDVLGLWRQAAAQVSGTDLPCGHYIAEELADHLLAQAHDFFQP
ncbi:MAG: alpha/beta fold hydrolase [Hylemonella sp.]